MKFKKEEFYVKRPVFRKNSIVDWYLESDNRADTVLALRIFLETNNISEFEGVIERHPEPAFMYIIEEGGQFDMARRLINKLSIRKRQPESVKKDLQRTYGTIKGKRVRVIKFTRIKFKSGKVSLRGRDSKGRFVKL